MRLIGYCRVSSEGQRENTSIATQAQLLKQYCRDHGFELACLRSDVETGTKMTREGFWQALRGLTCLRCPAPKVPITVEEMQAVLYTACKCKSPQPADGLIAYSLDRVGRNAQHLLWLGYDFFAKQRKDLIVLNGPGRCDTTSPEGRYLFGNLALVAQLFRDMTYRRSREGRKARAEAGAYVCGKPPYGLRRIGPGQLTRDDDEMALIEYFRFLRESGLSYDLIAQAVNAQKHKQRNGKPWRAASVYSVLTRESAIEAWFIAEKKYNYVRNGSY